MSLISQVGVPLHSSGCVPQLCYWISMTAHLQVKAGNGCKNLTVLSWFQTEIWCLPVLTLSNHNRGIIAPSHYFFSFLKSITRSIAINPHCTGRLWTNLLTHCCRSHLPQTSTSSTVQSFLPPGPSGPSPPPTGSVAVEYLPTVEQRDSYKVVEVERIEDISPPLQPPKDPAITRVEVEKVTF